MCFVTYTVNLRDTALAATVAAPVADVAALRVLQATYLCEG